MQYAVHRLDCESALGANFFDQRKIACATAAKTEIVADQHEFRMQFFIQGLDEIRCGFFGKQLIKAADMHAIHAHRAEQLQLFAQAGQPHRSLLRRKKLARVRLEDDHSRLQTARLCRRT